MIFESFIIKGYWWLPNNDNQKVPGILKVSPDSIILELFGSFKTVKDFGLKSYEIILGQDIDDNDITLFQTNEIRDYEPFLKGTDLSVRYVFLGKHFKQKRDIKFSSVSINFTYIEDWLSQKPLRDKVKYKEGYKAEEYLIRFTPPENYKVKIKSINSTLKIIYILKTVDATIQNITFQYSSKFILTSEQPQNFDWYKKNIDILINFLILVIGYPIEKKSYKAYVNEKLNEEIVIYERPSLRPKIRDKILSDYMLFSFPQLENEFENILNIWFDLSSKFENVFKLFFETFYESVIKPNIYFLSLYLSLEGYIKQKFNINKGIKYKIDKLLNNKPFNIIFDDYIIDKEIFSKKVEVTRDFLVHSNKKSEYVVENSIELFYLSERLRLILTIYLFNELKIPIKDICGSINRHIKFDRLKSQK